MTRISNPAPATFALACAAVVLLLALLIWHASDLLAPGRENALTDPTDFVAFYCGGRVLADGADPYRAGPLSACEHGVLAASGIAMVPYLVVPAPLPPYALAPFSFVSFAPFRFAAIAFFFASVAAIGGTIVLTCRLVPLERVAIGAAFGCALVFGSLSIGQIVPFVALALVGCALALRSGRAGLATSLAFVTMLEPHVGAAVLAGLFVVERRSRAYVAFGIVALGLVSLALAGPALVLGYARDVLPAHALAEVGNFHAQYSLTALAFALGANAETALRLGELSYATMAIAGTYAGAKLAARERDLAYGVATPAAFVLLGGPFIHIHQMALALPLAFLLARHTHRCRPVVAAIVLLAIPWQSIFESYLGPLFPPHVRFDPVPVLRAAWHPGALAETTWATWTGLLDGRDGRTPVEMLWFKLPTWFALAALAYTSVRVAGAGTERAWD